MTKQQLLEAAKNLPNQDRVDLAAELWDSIDWSEVPISEELAAELDRRVAEDDADASPGEDWETLKGKLRRGKF